MIFLVRGLTQGLTSLLIEQKTSDITQKEKMKIDDGGGEKQEKSDRAGGNWHMAA